MNSQNAIAWLKLEQFNQWILLRGQDKVSVYDSKKEDIDEGIARFAEAIQLQAPGKFTLKGYKGHSANASAMTFEFEIKPESNYPVQRSSPSSQPNAQDLFDQAKAAALMEFHNDLWKERVTARLDALEKSVQILLDAGKDLTDDDDENDETAIGKISQMAEQLPGIMAGLEAMKGTFLKK